MTSIGATVMVVATVATLALPRRFALVPLLVSAAYLSSAELIDIGGANFTVPRLVVAAGFIRMAIRKEGVAGGLQPVDWLVLLWGTLLIITSVLHTSDAWIYRFGLVWSEVGAYFMIRALLRDFDDVSEFFKLATIALLPLAMLMTFEKISDFNPFSVLSGVSQLAAVRNGNVRASGPFAHAILAGAVGGTYFGMGLCLVKRAPLHAAIGCAAGAAIVYASASSGPLLMPCVIALGWAAWPLRHHLRAVRWVLALGVLSLNAAMNDPVYFLMARVDLVGGSQGWFRARLIQSAFEHFPEWWLAGTDYTRHWMQTGIAVSSRHTDMTNHILSMGVLGGLPLMTVFVLILVLSLRSVGISHRNRATAPLDQRLFIWGLGALLVGLITIFMSITMFDQSITFFWLVVAAIGSAASGRHSPVSLPQERLPMISAVDFAVRAQPVASSR